MPLYFDATFSWSGYAYQGKVGVFVVLKHLNQYNGNNLNVYFNDWELEFEWLENFSIKQSGTYKSLLMWLHLFILRIFSNSEIKYQYE